MHVDLFHSLVSLRSDRLRRLKKNSSLNSRKKKPKQIVFEVWFCAIVMYLVLVIGVSCRVRLDI